MALQGQWLFQVCTRKFNVHAAGWPGAEVKIPWDSFGLGASNVDKQKTNS